MNNVNLTASQIKAINGPITISSLSSGNGTSVGQLIGAASHQGFTAQEFDFGAYNHEQLKKYEVYESKESVLTLSVAAQRLHTQNKLYYKITDRELFNKITPEDRVMADAIKDYYSKKVMMWKLTGNGQLSMFREEMNKLIHSDMLVFKETMIGIAYWLPYFYQYDIVMDVIKSQLTLNHKFEHLNKTGAPGTLKLTEKLIPLKRMKRNTKHLKFYEYWFKDTEQNAGVVINIEDKNPLKHLWDHLFDKNEMMEIEGWFTRRQRDDLEYYAVRDWNLKQA